MLLACPLPAGQGGPTREELSMSTVLAYLDAGSGSMILQAMLGGVAGLFVAIKMFGVRVKNTLFFWRKNDEEAPESAAAQTAPVGEAAPKAEVKTGA